MGAPGREEQGSLRLGTIPEACLLKALTHQHTQGSFPPIAHVESATSVRLPFLLTIGSRNGVSGPIEARFTGQSTPLFEVWTEWRKQK